jgi:hypothetical protein
MGKKVVGVKVVTVPKLCEDMGDKEYRQFLRECSLELEEFDLSVSHNAINCKHYDDETGEMHFIFDKPIYSKELEEFFYKDQIIYELEN